MTLINKNYLQKDLFFITVQRLVKLISVCRINDMHILDKYALVNFFLYNIIDSKLIYAYLIYKTHLIENLKAKLLLKINVLELKQFFINFNLKTARVESYRDIELFLKI